MADQWKYSSQWVTRDRKGWTDGNRTYFETFGDLFKQAGREGRELVSVVPEHWHGGGSIEVTEWRAFFKRRVG